MRTRGSRIVFWLVSLSIACVVCGCRGKGPSLPPPDPVPASPTEFTEHPAPIPPYMGGTERTREGDSAWPRLFLSDEEVPMDDPPVAVAGLAVTDEEFDQGFQSARRYNPTLTRDEYATLVRQELLILNHLRRSAIQENESFEDRARRTLRSELARLVLEQEGSNGITVSEEEIQRRYERDRDQYTQPKRVTIRVILVPSMAEARQVIARLETGEDFGALAGELSEHPSRSQGGQMEPFVRGTYSENIEEVAFSMQTGEIGTVTTSGGVLVIQKTAESAERVRPLEEVRTEIRERLLWEKRAAAQSEFLRRLEEDASEYDL